MKRFSHHKGFSLVEMLIVISILMVILAIALYSFTTAKSKKQLEIAVNSIDFKLEEAKTNALAGKNGKNFGIQFSSTTYVYFSGNSYNPSDTTNSSTTIASNLQISTSIAGDTVIFSRLTGMPQATGTITVTDTSNASNTASVSIGTLGDISVVK